MTWWGQVLAFLVLCFGSCCPALGAEKPITVGLVFDGTSAADRAPLQEYLTKAMGRPVRLEAPDRYADTVDRLADGTYDFACLGALMYVRAHAKYGVVPMVQRTSDLQFHTVFIAGAGSSIQSLRDLSGKQFAFGDLNSASGHLIPYKEIKQAGLNPDADIKARFSGSHVATAAMVTSGVVDAGALDETVFDALIRDGKMDSGKVRVFHKSKPFVDYVYVAGKGVSAADRQRFAAALLSLREGQHDSLLRILRANKFVPASDLEYGSIRGIAKELKMF